MKLKLCYKKVKFPPEIMLKKVIEPAMEAPKEDKTLNLFLSKLGKGVPLLCIEQLMKGKTEGSLFYTMYRERVRLIGDTVTIYTEKNKSGEETKSFSKKEVIEALYRREEYAKKIYSESILCEYLDNLSPNGMPKYLEILKDKKIENTYIDSEVWDVDIIKDKIIVIIIEMPASFLPFFAIISLLIPFFLAYSPSPAFIDVDSLEITG